MMSKRNEKISISLSPEVLYRVEEESTKENRNKPIKKAIKGHSCNSY